MQVILVVFLFSIAIFFVARKIILEIKGKRHVCDKCLDDGAIDNDEKIS